MLTLADIGFEAPRALLARYRLELIQVEDSQAIPGSFWGECEAGVIGHGVYARFDTPVHSLLHEASHLIVMPEEKRANIHTDASDCVTEEDAVCVLQALLGDELPGVGRERIWADMDTWGYTFRLGSAKAYFENDAEDVFDFLIGKKIINAHRQLRFTVPEAIMRLPKPEIARQCLLAVVALLFLRPAAATNVEHYAKFNDFGNATLSLSRRKVHRHGSPGDIRSTLIIVDAATLKPLTEFSLPLHQSVYVTGISWPT